jgi:hypothetical protein
VMILELGGMQLAPLRRSLCSATRMQRGAQVVCFVGNGSRVKVKFVLPKKVAWGQTVG